MLNAAHARDEFNAMREGLPQAVRRKVEPVPPGHIGLTAQAVSKDGGVPLLTLYEHIPGSADAIAALSALEARVRKALE
jgi:hypothetical protein